MRPPLWTSLHLDLLDCHFEDADDYDRGESPPHDPPSPGARRRALTPAERLSYGYDSKLNYDAVMALLDVPGSAFQATG